MRLLGLIVLSLVIVCQPLAVGAQSGSTGTSGLPVPRFVSLKSDRINVRVGPSREHDIAWIFVRVGLPVEIIQEFGNWRRIRDSQGAEGWVYHALLTGQRTALVMPWEDKPVASDLHTAPDATSRIVARLEPNVQAGVRECDGKWCHVAGETWSGWIEQARLWGVYPNEKIE